MENLPATNGTRSVSPLAAAATLKEKLEVIKVLAEADALPKHFKDKPGNLLLFDQISQDMRITFTEAISNFYVVNGNLTMKPDYMVGMVRKAGHRVERSIKGKGKDTEATTTVIRKENIERYDALCDQLIEAAGDEVKKKLIQEAMARISYSATWNWKKALIAGITDHTGWQNYPHAMPSHRADSEACRFEATDALGAAQYTPEEMGGDVREDGSYLITNVEPARPQTSRPAIPAGKPATASAPTAVKTPAPASAPTKPQTVQGTVVSRPAPAATAAPAAAPKAEAPATAKATTSTATLTDIPPIKGTMTNEQAQDLYGAVYDLVDSGHGTKAQIDQIIADVTKMRVSQKLVRVPNQDGTSKKMLLHKALALLSGSSKLA